MIRCTRNSLRRGLTLIELLCVTVIISILAALILGPAMRVLQKVRADQWAERAMVDLNSTVSQLRTRFQGLTDFPPVTLDMVESMSLVKSPQLRFLKDPQVTFTQFAGTDPDELVVIKVRLRRGFWTDLRQFQARKGDITRPPE